MSGFTFPARPAMVAAVTAWCACGTAAPPAPIPERNYYTNWIRERIGQAPPDECPIRPRVPGDTKTAYLPRGQVEIPATYVYAFRTLPVATTTFLGGGPGQRAELWRPGIGLPPSERWVGGSSEDLVLQFDTRKTYIPLALDEGWEMTSAFECRTAVGHRTARVLVFTLDHPAEGRIHGLAAITPSPRTSGSSVSILGLGEAEASLAEFLGILKTLR